MIDADVSKVTYTGDGSVNTFRVTFPFTRGVDGTYLLSVTVDGIPADWMYVDENTIQIVGTPPVGSVVVIRREQPIIQLTSLQNSSMLPFTSIEEGMDYLNKSIQMVRDRIADAEEIFIAGALNWKFGLEYKKGALVLYDGDIYQAIEDNSELPSDDTKWVLYLNQDQLSPSTLIRGSLVANANDIAGRVSIANVPNVVSNVVVSPNNDDENVALSISRTATATGTTATTDAQLPYASETTAGMMVASDYRQLLNVSDITQSLLNGAVSVNTLVDNPTQAQILTAWQNATGETTPLNQAAIFDSVHTKKYVYYTNVDTWQLELSGGTAVVNINQATNTALGLVRGLASTPGYASVNGDGSLWITGFDVVSQTASAALAKAEANEVAIAANTVTIAANKASADSAIASIRQDITTLKNALNNTYVLVGVSGISSPYTYTAPVAGWYVIQVGLFAAARGGTPNANARMRITGTNGGFEGDNFVDTYMGVNSGMTAQSSFITSYWAGYMNAGASQTITWQRFNSGNSNVTNTGTVYVFRRLNF